MIAYFLLWGVTVFLSVISVDRQYRAISTVLIIFIFVLFVGLRPVSLGTDTLEYKYIYDNWIFGFFDSDIDALFSFVTTMLKNLSASFDLWLCVLFFIFISPLLYVLHKVYSTQLIFLLIASSTNFWLYSINIIRQGMAVSIYMLAVYFYLQYGRRDWRWMFCAICAIGMHLSIIVPVIFLLCYGNGMRRLILKNLFFIFILFFVLTLVGFDLVGAASAVIEFVSFMLPDRLLEKFFIYSNSEQVNELSIGFYYFMCLGVLFLSWLLRNGMKISLGTVRYKFFDYSICAVAIFVVFYPAITSYDVLARVLGVFGFFAIFLIYEINFTLVPAGYRVGSLIVAASILFVKLVFSGYDLGFISDRF